MIRYGSLFSGIGGFDLGLDRAGMECAWQCEIDPACNQVLERHWPGTLRFKDVRNVGKDAPAVDLICGGFPCQDLSIAGRRAGLAGERSGLWYEFHRILAELRPEWVVIENVPGLLSSNSGRDFAIILHGLVKLRYGVCWRVLDAQYFGLAQRRKRVFIVGHLGDGRAAEVLFEREGGSWNTPPSREKGEGTATATLRGFGHGWQGQHNDTNAVTTGWDTQRMRIHDADGIAPTMSQSDGKGGQRTSAFGGNNTSGEIDAATAVNAHGSRRYDFESETFVACTIQQNDGGDHKRKDRPNGGMYVNQAEKALTIGSTDQTVIAHSVSPRSGTEQGWNANLLWHNKQQSGEVRIQGDTVNSVTKQWRTGGNNVPFVGVRRLTPTECARLQGFPDDWNDWLSDSARYRQFGNAVAVPVAEWIARRIQEMHRER